MKSSTPAFHSRVVNVSSTAHGFSTVQFDNLDQHDLVRNGFDALVKLEPEEMDGNYNPMIAYGQSKTANIWTANELERRYGSKGLHGLSVHPGNIFTAGYGSMDPRAAKKFEPFFQDPNFVVREMLRMLWFPAR